MFPRGRKTQLVPCFGSVEFATCLWIACAVVTLVASQQSFYNHNWYGKRHDPRAGSVLVSGSRYGRSDGFQKDGKSLPKLVQVVPRVDRFFWGSRYGKRSPPDYRTVSSVNRFSAVLDFMDRVNEVDLERGNDASNVNDPDLLS